MIVSFELFVKLRGKIGILKDATGIVLETDAGKKEVTIQVCDITKVVLPEQYVWVWE